MTREEAIKRLKEARNTIQPFRYVDEAIDYAIKALEQEPCDDCVSRGVFEQVMWERDTAIEQLHELGYELGQKKEPCDDAISRTDMLDAIGHGTTYTSEDLQRIIKALPSVLPKREQGNWIEVHPLQEDDGGAYMCSKCRCGHPYIAPHWKYCPNCGAEMR